MTPNEVVVRTLFTFLDAYGVACWWENDIGIYCGHPYDGSNSGVNPFFFTGLNMRGGGKFKVRYVGRTGEVVVTAEDIIFSGVKPVNVFPVCDPDCFDQVLEFVK